MSDSHVFEATVANFQDEVAERSMTQAVLLDFWAEWCQPCKSFTPVLEQLAADYGGGFALGKVNIDTEAQLSQAFQVQSVPFVVLLVKGRPADAFAGAISEDELRALLSRHGVEPLDPTAEAEPELVPADQACLSAAAVAAVAGDAAAARDALTGFPEESQRIQERDNLLRGLEFIEAKLAADQPADSAAGLLFAARQAFFSGQYEAALTGIVESARQDRGFSDGLARRAMLLCQVVVEDSELLDGYRRQLATLLY